MKNITFATLLLITALTFFSPAPAIGQEDANYLELRAGAYIPLGDLDDANFDEGLIGEFALGHFLSPNFAIEGTVGFFETDATVSGTNAALGTFSQSSTLTVIPLTLTAKGFIPTRYFDLY